MSRQELSKIVRMDELDMKIPYEKLDHGTNGHLQFAANVILRLFISGEYSLTSWSPNTYQIY